MSNEATFSVAGYVATRPEYRHTKTGVPTLTMRLAWTPRRLDRATNQWADEPSCFVSVQCFRRVAENARFSLDKGDPVVVSGTLRIRDYDAKDGSRRTNVDIIAASIGHDLSRGVTAFRRLRPPSERDAEDQLAAGPAGRDLGDGADEYPGGSGLGAAGEPTRDDELDGDDELDAGDDADADDEADQDVTPGAADLAT
jgi:single-strand DNA-binding protein